MGNQKHIILAIPGSGKSYVVKKYKNLVDNDFCYFRFLYDKPVEEMTEKELEERKGNPENERLNPQYPENLVEATFKNLEKNKVVLIPLTRNTYTIIKDLDNQGKLDEVNVIMVYPKKKEYAKFISRYKGRGNGEAFIKDQVKHYKMWLKIFKKEKKFDKYYMKSNEYLENVLLSLEIPLELK